MGAGLPVAVGGFERAANRSVCGCPSREVHATRSRARGRRRLCANPIRVREPAPQPDTCTQSRQLHAPRAGRARGLTGRVRRRRGAIVVGAVLVLGGLGVAASSRRPTGSDVRAGDGAGSAAPEPTEGTTPGRAPDSSAPTSAGAPAPPFPDPHADGGPAPADREEPTDERVVELVEQADDLARRLLPARSLAFSSVGGTWSLPAATCSSSTASAHRKARPWRPPWESPSAMSSTSSRHRR